MYYFFLSKTSREKVFDNIFGKRAILGIENVDLLMVKSWNFPIFLWFLSKLGNVENFSPVGKQVRESVRGFFLYSKQAILDEKNVDLLMVKKMKFSKGVSPWFLPKIKNFEIVPFRTY